MEGWDACDCSVIYLWTWLKVFCCASSLKMTWFLWVIWVVFTDNSPTMGDIHFRLSGLRYLQSVFQIKCVQFFKCSICFCSRGKLRESYQHVLKLLMEMVKATVAIEDLICSKVGLCLDDSLASGDSKEAQSIMEEMGFMQYFKAKENHHLEKGEYKSANLGVINSYSWKLPFPFVLYEWRSEREYFFLQCLCLSKLVHS